MDGVDLVESNLRRPQKGDSPVSSRAWLRLVRSLFFSFAWWEWGLVFVAGLCAFGLGVSNLGVPSLWHDELVHVFVGKSIAESGRFELPSGTPYYNGTTFNILLAASIKLFSDAEVSFRFPSVLLATLNVLLTFVVVRPVLGRGTAIVAAFALALSPWALAWSREARFYTLQQTLYLVTVGAFWQATVRRDRTALVLSLGCALLAYALGILTSFHSILFLCGVGAFAVFMAASERTLRSRWIVHCVAIGIVGILTLLSFNVIMNPLDHDAVFERGGLGGELHGLGRAYRWYYTHWLRINLSRGFYYLALAGTAIMLLKEGRRGFFVAATFWAPILILTFFIGYRRPRFMFFVFPMYVALYSYAIVFLVQSVPRLSRSSAGRVALAILFVFSLRLCVSFATLIGDSLETASGAHTTLARKHPQWRLPGTYVREHRKAGEVVLTTTYLPALYYAGSVDNWYPTHYHWWEVDESGIDDLKTLEDFKAYVRNHPKGYYISEWWRFERNRFPEGDVRWVKENMKRIEEACSEDVTLWTWGM